MSSLRLLSFGGLVAVVVGAATLFTSSVVADDPSVVPWPLIGAGLALLGVAALAAVGLLVLRKLEREVVTLRKGVREQRRTLERIQSHQMTRDRLEVLLAETREERLELGGSLAELRRELLRELGTVAGEQSSRIQRLQKAIGEIVPAVERLERSLVGGLGADAGGRGPRRPSIARAVSLGLDDAVSDGGPVQRLVREENTTLFRLLDSLDELRRHLGLDGPLPLFGRWAIRPDLGLHLVQTVLERRPSSIVDVGSGLSTVLLAAAARSVGTGHVLSLDHLDEYAESTRAHLRRLELDAWATVHTAPLTDTDVGGEPYSWYDLASVELPPTIDLLFVDGPPGPTGPMARFPAVPVLRDLLASDAVVLLDDANRADEARVVARWAEALGLEPQFLDHQVGTAEFLLTRS